MEHNFDEDQPLAFSVTLLLLKKIFITLAAYISSTLSALMTEEKHI